MDRHFPPPGVKAVSPYKCAPAKDLVAHLGGGCINTHNASLSESGALAVLDVAFSRNAAAEMGSHKFPASASKKGSEAALRVSLRKVVRPAPIAGDDGSRYRRPAPVAQGPALPRLDSSAPRFLGVVI